MKIVSAEFETSVVDVKKCPAGGRPEVALAGRSNVGKSSLFNKMVNRKGLARTSNTPGRTQMINYFLINGQFYLVDLPGYGFAKVPEAVKVKWGKLVEGYLNARENLRGVVQLVDIRHAPSALDIQMYQWLKHFGVPTAVVATKVDKLSRSQAIKQLAVVKKTLSLENEPLVTFSAQTGQGKDELWKIIEDWIS